MIYYFFIDRGISGWFTNRLSGLLEGITQKSSDTLSYVINKRQEAKVVEKYGKDGLEAIERLNAPDLSQMPMYGYMPMRAPQPYGRRRDPYSSDGY